ncbi:MAG: hypothetical protein RL514_316 [Verrucomicrobiota bacterium]|jgi:hypothetical protein
MTFVYGRYVSGGLNLGTGAGQRLSFPMPSFAPFA